MDNKFEIISDYKPSGDQPKAIDELCESIDKGNKHQVLLGVTGSGKTFTMANVIARENKPTLILEPNKTLAGQLYAEMKELFPNNRVEYFVSYYDYYQPEAYVPQSDTYIEKDASINDEIDELRHSATESLLTRRDTIVVASVSCIYGLGDKEDYKNECLVVSVGDNKPRETILSKLIDMNYERNEIDFHRGTFRSKGDTIDIVPIAEKKNGIRIELFGDEVDRICEFDIVTGSIIKQKHTVMLFPATHFVTNKDKLNMACDRIEAELKDRLKELRDNNKLLEAERLEQRCNYDLEMLRETGFCHGIENYSRHLGLREAGSTPCTLMDFFDDDYLLFIDESHITLPQVRGMYNGDRMRKQTLVDYGFRLPSALDNRPLKFDEFEDKTNQIIYVSATPGDYELDLVNNKCIEQLIRPTGLLDPITEVRPTEGQIDDLIGEINERINKNERVLVTTLTIRMAEELTAYLKGVGIKVAYLHTEVKTLERLKIIKELRQGKYDVLVGINLLREGIDLPEVSLIAIMDADKQGFLRSYRSLIQIIGRCARNSEGKVIMYADTVSESMDMSIKETNRRRTIQDEYNKEHGIVPKTIIKKINDVVSNEEIEKLEDKKLSKQDKLQIISVMEQEMKDAAKNLDFEKAAELRDLIFELKSED
ncbi:MAG: excinuclease ABC subunit UvrB [Bacilli bacterium]|nr:excinuclease ABC subunit UvrB [Bacilli bacterium]